MACPTDVAVLALLSLFSTGADGAAAATSATAAPSLGPATAFGTVDALDWTVVVSALLGTLLLGLWVASKSSGSAGDYFVGSRAMAWQVVGASMFASNIGTEHFVGQAGSAAAGGMGVGLYEWLSVYLLLALAYFFSPFYVRLGLTTVPQYVQERFGSSLRLCVTLICLTAYVLTKISATLFTGVILVEVLYGGEVNVYFVAVILVIITASYTVAGGLKAVMITDAMQMVIFIVGGFAGLWVSLSRVGFAEMHKLLPEEFFHVVRPKGEYAWHAMFLGQPVGACWYWCIDQFIVQRVLAAKNLRHAQSGALFAAAMKFLPPYLLCIPGMAARTLFERCRLSPTDGDRWCETGLDDAEKANKAYPLLVVLEFPAGLRGLIITAMFMAMLSSLSSVYNSAATLITIDIYKTHLNPASTDRQLVIVGRAASLLMTGLTFAWFPVLTSHHGLLYLFVQMVSMHLFPTLVVIFLLGMLSTRVNTQGAIAGLGAGFILGMAQMVSALAAADRCAKPFFKWECMHFNHFAIILAVSVAFVSILTSLCFPPPSAKQLSGRTIWTLRSSYANFDDEDEAGLENEGGDATRADSMTKSSETGGVTGSGDVEFVIRDDSGMTGGAETPSGPHAASIGHPSLQETAGTVVNGSKLDKKPVAEQSPWARHDCINLGVALTLFVLMAANLYAWA